jgi:hypothetical protein
MEKIRRLAALLETGIREYDDAVQTLQSERLKYLRLSLTDGFGEDANSSRGSWLSHLRAMEIALNTRLDALRQAVINSAVDLQRDLAESTAHRSSTEPTRLSTDDEPEPPDVEKV